MRLIGIALRITGALIALLLIIFVALTYQPIRHVMYNNTNEIVRMQQQHYGRIIAQGDTAYINGLFETPLSNRIVVGKEWLNPKISFGADGEIQIRTSSTIIKTIRLPKSWSRDRIVWLEYSYQLNADGSIILLDSSSKPPVTNIGTQPAGFPIHLIGQMELK